MPTPQQILEQLQSIASQFTWLAIAWHLVVAIVAIAMIIGWRPQARAFGVLVIAPVLSVVVVSIIVGSWFNAATFGVLAVVCATLTDDRRRVSVQPREWPRWIALALIAFGFVYPHFVDGVWYRSLYASPVGLVPCPTLAIVAGFALLVQTRHSRALCAVLAGWTAFYALFGMVRLGVWLDIGLLVATAALATASFPIHRRAVGMASQP